MIKLYNDLRNNFNLFRLEDDDGRYVSFQTLPELYHRKKHVWTIGISAADLPEYFEIVGEFENSTALFAEHKRKYPEEYI